MNKRGQQEIAGFVIIVVLVVVAVFIFMIISLRNQEESTSSVEVESLLSSLLEQTTDCVVREPIPEDVRGLIKEAYGGVSSNCGNLGKNSRDYLNETVYFLMDNVLKTETRFGSYQFDIYSKENELLVYRAKQGSCGDKTILGSDELISSSAGTLQVVLQIC